MKKFSDSVKRSRLPTKTNISISEMPVMISGFIIGMSVTVMTAAFRYFLRIFEIPYAAAVPITVDMTAEVTARITEFLSA